MAKGEQRYNGEGKTVARFDNKPIPIGPYQLELQEDQLQVKKSDKKGPDAIPYINSMLRALGTAADKPGAKDRIVFHKWFLSMKPGSDGVIMPERGGGIVEFCRSYGEEADFGIKTMTLSDESEVSYFDPDEVLAYLQSKVGEPRQAQVTIEPKKDENKQLVKGHPGDNKISYWQLDEAVMTGEEAKPSAPAPKTNGKPLPKKK